jgi:hypothetical protein
MSNSLHDNRPLDNWSFAKQFSTHKCTRIIHYFCGFVVLMLCKHTFEYTFEIVAKVTLTPELPCVLDFWLNLFYTRM